jgi:hypothetical protein
MSRARRISEELGAHLDSSEADEIEAVAERLGTERPRPRPGFRAELRRSLSDPSSLTLAMRPKRLRLVVAAYCGSGCLLLGVAAIGLAGSGPLG